MSTIVAIILTGLGSNGLFVFIQWLIDRNSVLKKTLEAVSYAMLADKLEEYEEKRYATSEQRKEMDILIEAYKKNGWNGDMDARIKRFYDLPIKKSEKE